MFSQMSFPTTEILEQTHAIRPMMCVYGLSPTVSIPIFLVLKITPYQCTRLQYCCALQMLPICVSQFHYHTPVFYAKVFIGNIK